MRKLPPLNAVKAFEVAARHVSFTKAAAELSVTHGAVSRQVALLEDWLGAPLFRRSASLLTLTEAGRSYLAEVAPLLDRLAVASMHLREQAAPTAITVSAPPTFTMRWLIPRMSAFQRRHEGVEIRVTTSLAPVNFRENSYDVAIRGQSGPTAENPSVPIMTEIIAPVCHVDLAPALRSGKPRELRGQTLIAYGTEPYTWADWLESVDCQGLKPANTLQFEQMYFALQAAAEGLGLVLVPLFLVIDDIVAGRLTLPFGLTGAKRRTYFANHATPAGLDSLVGEFCAWLQREGGDTERSTDDWAAAQGWRL
ncbi:MAG TPA: LysR substrate-binding domain-containing protein [Burkholderiales bacterium]|jgi:LysR family glycine cleavage system transcriptional activator